MRRIIVLVFLVFVNIPTGLFAQSEFYYTNKGEKEFFKIRKDKVILKTKSAVEAKALSKQTIFRSAHEVSYDCVIATIDTLVINLDELKHRSDVVDAAFALEHTSDVFYYSTGRIAVKLKEGQSMEKFLNDTDLKKSVESIELFDPYSELYVITLNKNLGDILHISRNLYETGLCVIVAPSLIWEMKPHNTYYSNQWGLKQNSGIDIKAEQAWQITRGNNEIRVAVIDEGVNLTHPDLQANLLLGLGFDAVPNNQNPGGANGSPFGTNAHGTACAGIIGAINNTIGIVGVAPSVRMIPVRIAFNNTGFGWTTDDAWVANGINHAWQTANADVLSCSFGGAWQPLTDGAITNAVNFGRLRNGVPLGCVVVASSGNNNSSIVSFPANLPNVIAVCLVLKYVDLFSG